MNKRWLLIFMMGTFGDACSVDENATGDGGTDASSDGTTDAVADASKDSSNDAVVTCDAGKSCGAPSDCPATPTVCIARDCTNGCCGTTFTAVGAPCTEDGGVVCDGTGHCVACNQKTDCIGAATCTTAACNNNDCTFNPDPVGTACTNDAGGKVCDGTGLCVTCNQASDCTGAATCTTAGCSNNNCTFNPDPVGTACVNDAGGKVCDGTGQCVACNQGSDCPTPTTVCMTAMCSNNNCAANNTATGTSCNEDGGHFCDGIGSCVQCNSTQDCLLVYDAGTCVNSKCM